jgi:hypothetical protein
LMINDIAFSARAASAKMLAYGDSVDTASIRYETHQYGSGESQSRSELA